MVLTVVRTQLCGHTLLQEGLGNVVCWVEEVDLITIWLVSATDGQLWGWSRLNGSEGVSGILFWTNSV